MAPIGTLHYLVVAAALFIIGTIGVITRRNVVVILMSIELILNAVNLNLVAFSRLYGLHGQVFSIFVVTDAAGGLVDGERAGQLAPVPGREGGTGLLRIGHRRVSLARS